MNKIKEIHQVCDKCGLEANRLTCIKRFGEEPKKAKFDVSTYNETKCDICGKLKMCTEPRDFFYPDFSLLTNTTNKDI